MSHPQPSRTSLSQPLLSIVADSPAAEKVLERFGVDYWFGGSHTLEEGCEKAAVSAGAVAEQLCKLTIRKGSGEALTAVHLTGLISSHYDTLMKPLLRECDNLLREIRAAHKHRELGQAAQLFRCIDAEAGDHILLGRSHLYPYFVELEAAVSSGATLKQMRLAAFWRSRMAIDHNDFADNLKQLRRVLTVVSADLAAPASVRQFLDQTAELQRQLHHHMLLEYQFLFPLSLQLEKNAKFVDEKGNAASATVPGGERHRHLSS